MTTPTLLRDGPAGADDLLEQRDLYEALVLATSNLEHGLALTKGTRVVFANDAIARMLGVAPEEFLEGEFDPLVYMAPGEMERLTRDYRGGTGEASLFHYTVTLRRADGSTFPAEIASTGVTIHGELHRLALVRDVTALHRSQQELEVARRQLALTEKLAALGSLVSGVAHEVRTPLTVIETNLQILAGRAERARRTGDYAPLAEIVPVVVADVSSAIERAQGLVRSLRRLTKAERVTTSAPLEPAVREAVDLFVSVNRGRARVDADFSPTPSLRIDKAKIQQVVLNLLDNAMEASQGSPQPIAVRTFVDGDGRRAAVQVRDAGVGMSEEVQSRMFEPLFTTRHDGTGLGLAIVRRIVEEHGGAIECESAAGRGTTFTVWLPVEEPAEA